MTIASVAPDLVIADFLSDDPSGMALATLNARQDGPPLIYYSVSEDPLRDDALLRSGAAVDLIHSPAPARLLASARRALRQQATLRLLAEAQAELVDAHRADFLPLMMESYAHELRNMLQPLMYSAQRLRRRPDDTQLLRDSLDGSVRRGLDIVSSMLAYGHDRREAVGVIDVEALVRNVRAQLPANSTRGVGIRFESSAAILPCAATQVEAEQCLVALSRRALAGMRHRDELVIRVNADPGRQWLSLSLHANRPPAAHEDRGSMDGVGGSRELLLCRTIAARHRGSVQFDSSVPAQLAVEIRLPLLTEHPQVSDRSPRVLVTSRSGPAMKALLDAATRNGFIVDLVDGSQAAVAVYDRKPAAVAIIDGDLPALEDVRTYAALQKRRFGGPTIVLQSPGANNDRMPSGNAVVFMTKPANGDALFASLRSHKLRSAPPASPAAAG